MKRQSFIISAIILTLGGFFSKAIGAIYKIPLTNILGSTGMGLYYLVFPVYSLLIVICSSGISIAVTTEVAKCRKMHHRYNEQIVLRVSLLITFILSTLIAFGLIVFSKVLADSQGNINAKLGYIAIAPAVIISSVIAVIRGYFQGIENMVPTTISLIIEQMIKLLVGLFLAHKLCVYGVSVAVLGAIIGVTFSEVVALIIIAINFFIYKGQLHYNYRNLGYKSRKKKQVQTIIKTHQKFLKCKVNIRDLKYLVINKDSRYSYSIAFKKLIGVSIPATLFSLVLPVATMLDSFMIINILQSSGYSSVISTSLYGMLGGIVQTLIGLPAIIISAVATTLVPSLSGLVAQNDTNEIRYRVKFFIKITWLMSIGMFVIVYVFSGDIISFLYGKGLSTDVIDEFFYITRMLQLCSVGIIYQAFMQTFIAILQSVGKSSLIFIIMLIGLILRTVLVYVLVSIPNINIFGTIIANTIFLIFISSLMAIVIKNNVYIEYKFIRELLLPGLYGIGSMLILVWLCNIMSGMINYIIKMLILSIVFISGYILYLYISKTFTRRERNYFVKQKLRKTK